MTFMLGIVIALLVGDLVLLAYLLASRSFDPAITVSLAEIGPLVIGAGILVALITFVINLRRQSSEDFLKSANELLERAYTVLSNLDEKGRPKNNRMNWLAAARFLRASENVNKLITAGSHKAIYREHKEYWRARLRDLIIPSHEGFPENYYADTPEKMVVWGDEDRDPLSEKSLTVLYRFVRWPEGFEDPIKTEPNFTEEEIEKMQMFGPRGLGNLMRKVRTFESQHKSKA